MNEKYEVKQMKMLQKTLKNFLSLYLTKVVLIPKCCIKIKKMGSQKLLMNL